MAGWTEALSEATVREDLLSWIDQRTFGGLEPIRSSVLNNDFISGGVRYTLQSQQGIIRPRGFRAPLTITTVYRPPGRKTPYEDGEITGSGLFAYRYQGKDPNSYQNVALRQAFKDKIPLVWLRGIAKGEYMAVSPIWIAFDEPENLRVLFAPRLDTPLGRFEESSGPDSLSPSERRYRSRQVMQRVHQPYFRQEVLKAYRDECAICSLRLRPLLDAAHVIPDAEEDGFPVVPNGVSLCKIHHAAFDSNIIGIDPKYRVHVSQKILNEIDGPMLKHGIQEADGRTLALPRSKAKQPDPDRLEVRWSRFIAAQAG